MYGLVNRALEDLIRSTHGDAAWERIKEQAQVDTEVFIRMDAYPDDITYRLVGAASDLLQVPANKLLHDFGLHWTLYTGREGYGAMLDDAGQTLQEVLDNLDELHMRVGLMYPQLQPPSFRCTHLSPTQTLLEYHSRRPGLAPMVVGLVEGLGRRFGQSLRINQQSDRAQGAAFDSFLVEVISNSPP